MTTRAEQFNDAIETILANRYGPIGIETTLGIARRFGPIRALNREDEYGDVWVDVEFIDGSKVTLSTEPTEG